MLFLLIICHDDTFQPTAALVDEILQWDREMDRRGIRISGLPLRPASEAVSLCIRDGKRQVSAGPLKENGLPFAACELIECPDAQSAQDAAASHPMAREAVIEIRPVWMELTG